MTAGALDAGELVVRVVSDTGRLDKDVAAKVNQAGAAGGKAAERSARDVAGKMRGLGNGLSLGLTLPLLAVGKAAVGAASDTVEAVNKTNVVFGASAQVVTSFAETSAKAFGISKREALGAAGTFGNLFRAMGVGEKQSAKTSVEFTKLAGDLASFNNADPAEVLDALRSGLLGEAEPLRKFGVQLSETRVAAVALAEGIVAPVKNMDKITSAGLAVEDASLKVTAAIKKHGEGSIEARKAMDALEKKEATLKNAMKGTVPVLTDEQKLLARRAIIMKDTTLAQGDFSRSLSTSAANQERVSKATADDAQANLGKVLLPLYQSAVQVLGQVAGGFAKLGPTGQKAVVVTAGLLAVLGPLLRVGASVGKVWALGARVIRSETAAKVANAIVTKTAAAAQWLLNAAMSANPVMLVVIALVALAAIFVVAYRKSAVFRAVVNAAFAAIGKAAAAVFGWFKKNWPLLLAILTGPIGLAVLAIVRNWDKIKAAATAVYRWVKSRFDAVVAFVTGLPKRIGRAAAGMWDGIKDSFRSALNWLIRAWNGLQFRIPGFDPPGPGPKFGGFTLGLPDIPELGAGGVVRHRRGGQVVRVAERGKDEIVGPLDEVADALGGGGAYFAEGAIKVYNPAPEPASASVHKRIRRLVVMGVGS